MNVSPLLLMILLAAVFAAGFGLGIARSTWKNLAERSREEDALEKVRAESAEWRAKAAEAGGRAEVLERENGELAGRAREDQKLAHMISPLSAQLQDMTDRVANLQVNQASQAAMLHKQLETAVETSKALGRETASLRTALTSVSSRGTWGEVELRRIVEASGMLQHVDFSLQQSVSTTTRGTASESSSSARPDLTVHLPGDTHIAVDAKVPLTALLRAQEIDEASEKDAARRRELLTEHARALREHVKELSKRDYPGQFPGSPRITVLFLPAESLLSEALSTDPSLLDEALALGVTPATPSSLLALLRSVAAVWSSTQITQEAQEVLALGRKLTRRLGTVADHLGKLGASLRSSVDRYNKTVASLESRVLATVREFESLDVDLPPARLVENDAAQVRAISAPELKDASEERE